MGRFFIICQWGGGGFLSFIGGY